MKKILIILGHPDTNSFCYHLCETYLNAAKNNGAEVKQIIVAELSFNPSLKYGYKKTTSLEKDLLESQKLIKWADHLVFIYPIWWGTMPALLKGFIDRVFIPGFAFKYRTNSICWDKLLIDKTARVITTMDAPYLIYRLLYGRSGHYQIKNLFWSFVV